MQNDHLCACSFGGSVVSLKQRMRHSGREAVPQKLVWNIKEVLFVKHFISRRNFLKVCAVAGSAVALSACGGSKKAAAPDPSNTDQTSFDIVGGQSALSPGYNDNEVLKKLADNVGVKLNYETMSDSLSEQVNIRIAGDQLPDAFMGVGFSNYDIANYGADGTCLDLTPYINAEIMPNLTKILDEHPNIRAAITMSDGCIYGLPAAEQMGTAGIGDDEDYSIFTIPQFSMINKRWLDEPRPFGCEPNALPTELRAHKKAPNF